MAFQLKVAWYNLNIIYYSTSLLAQAGLFKPKLSTELTGLWNLMQE